MPTLLKTTLSEMQSIPNQENAAIIQDYYKYLRFRETSETHQNNTLKIVIEFAKI